MSERISSVWRPSPLARFFAGEARWLLRIDVSGAVLRIGDEDMPVRLEQLIAADVARQGVWSSIGWPGLPGRLGGLRRPRAAAVRTTSEAALAEQERVTAWHALLRAEAGRLLGWWSDVLAEWPEHSWISMHRRAGWSLGRPVLTPDVEVGLDARHPALVKVSGPSLDAALEAWGGGLELLVAEHNKMVLEREPVRLADFFNTVEKSPLSDEQVQAVLCFDNRVQVVAAAGSGKTSTMIARAAYAIRERLVRPEAVLMLSFNKGAAKELADRVRSRLPDVAVTSTTLHAFGLKVVGEATGRRPALSQEAEERGGEALLERLTDNLRRCDPAFAAAWTLFRLVFARELPPFDATRETPSGVQTAASDGLFTLDGKVVRSHEERIICDWLYVNGVEYIYERDYEHATADGAHRQYQPDFFYPSANAYHEHFALDRNGQPPPHFAGYLEGVEWKRELHRTWGTTLLETTSATIRDGSGFSTLAGELTRRGVRLDPQERPATDPSVIVKDRDVFTLLRTFLGRVKNGSLSDADLRAAASTSIGSSVRARVFLDVFLPLRAAWNQRLRDSGTVDFDDMILLATDYIRAGRWHNPYELVMVDEFQDTSGARAALVAELVNGSNRHLFTVGDDWQSINRFAGADMTVMTTFHTRFGAGHTLRLQRTFRSPQSLCDVAGQFVSRNPAQLPKQVVSLQPDHPPTITVVAIATRRRADDRNDAGRRNDDRLDDTTNVIRGHLDRLNLSHVTADPGSPHQTRSNPSNFNSPTHRATVLILSRYRRSSDDIDQALKPESGRWPHLEIRHATIHASKGREADHVIITGVEAGGFPNRAQDDPLLQIPLPDPDPYPDADERRLFYVALTRARVDVVLLTRAGKESPFIRELINDGVQLRSPNGQQIQIVDCPKCGARMVQRDGKKGPFWGCSRFPATGCKGSRSNTYRPPLNP